MQAMTNIPGVQAMDIGAGVSKPMIRGMGFNPGNYHLMVYCTDAAGNETHIARNIVLSIN